MGVLGVLDGVMNGTGVGKTGVGEGNAVGVACLLTRVGMGVLDGPAGIWMDGHGIWMDGIP